MDKKNEEIKILQKKRNIKKKTKGNNEKGKNKIKRNTKMRKE